METEIQKTDTDILLRTALDVGAGLLRCGGEIQRVEDTVSRICYAYGAVHVEVFTITSLIVASVRMPDGSYSNQTRRLRNPSVNNLYQLSMYNAISRDICDGRISLDEAQAKLHEVKYKMPYPDWVLYIGSFLAAGGFTLFFGGDFLDAIVAALIGLGINFLETRRPTFINGMAQSVVSSFAAGILAMLLTYFGICHNVDKVMIGTIMLMIPGLTIGTSIRDMLCGDTLTGSMRLAQSIILAIVIALGYVGAQLLMEVILK